MVGQTFFIYNAFGLQNTKFEELRSSLSAPYTIERSCRLPITVAKSSGVVTHARLLLMQYYHILAENFVHA